MFCHLKYTSQGTQITLKTVKNFFFRFRSIMLVKKSQISHIQIKFNHYWISFLQEVIYFFHFCIYFLHFCAQFSWTNQLLARASAVRARTYDHVTKPTNQRLLRQKSKKKNNNNNKKVILRTAPHYMLAVKNIHILVLGHSNANVRFFSEIKWVQWQITWICTFL